MTDAKELEREQTEECPLGEYHHGTGFQALRHDRRIRALEAELAAANPAVPEHSSPCDCPLHQRIRALEAENAFEKSEKQRLAKLLSDTYERAGKAEARVAENAAVNRAWLAKVASLERELAKLREAQP